MRTTKRVLALAVSGLLLAACSHKDKDAPLAFVPADTPYVFANLDVLSDDTRQAIFAQVDAQLPAQVMQLKGEADQLEASDADTAKFLRVFASELDGKTIEQIVAEAGADPKGYTAFYGMGLSPVFRAQLANPQAFQAFVAKLQNDFGKHFDTATIGNQSYQHVSAPTAHLQLVLATVGKQLVLSIVPDDASPALLRQVLGLDRPAHSLQDAGTLDDLVKDKGYAKYGVGEIDLTKLMPLITGNQDPLAQALLKARAESESAKTGEPVGNLMQVPATCQADAQRIASRVPLVSAGYTQLDTTHRDIRMDVSLADDIASAFSGLKVELPGLGADPSAPFDLSLALPMAQLRTFWGAQVDAVAAKPFSCPSLDSLNDSFTSLGSAVQKAAMPPIGDLLGVHLALDSFTSDPNGGMPKASGRVVIGTNNPAGLLAMAQVTSPLLSGVKLSGDGKPAALPAQLTSALGESAWAAMGSKAIGVAVGDGEDQKLSATLGLPGGDAGQLMRMRLDGAMYANWIHLMAQRAESTATLAAAMNPDPNAQKAAQAELAGTKARFAAMEQDAQKVQEITAEVHMDAHGLVITSHTSMK